MKYFCDWKESIATRPGQFTKNAKANMFITLQTYNNIKITVRSSIDLIKYLLSQNIPHVMTERFCQDHRKDNPSLRDFGYNDNTIQTTKLFRPIAGNCRNDDPKIAKIDVETVPCRPRNKNN